METQERMERELSLTELFWNVLLGWRKIASLCILFAVLVSGVGYWKEARVYRKFQEIDLEEEKEKLEMDDLSKLERAVHVQTRLDEYEAYRDHSPLLQLDPYNKPVLELQYYVQSDYIVNYTKDSERDYTLELTAMYYNFINGGELAGKITEEVKLPESQSEFRELMNVTKDQNTIVITIGYGDAGKLDDISKVVKNSLQQQESKLQDMGAHNLKLMGESQNVVTDSVLLEKKNSVFNSINSLTNIMNNLKDEMSSQQLKLFRLEMEEIRGEHEEAEEPGFSIKYLLLGAFAGIFLACAWIAGSMIFTIRLQNPEELRGMYGVRLLGTAAVSRRKKRFLPYIDTLILKIRYRGRKQIAQEQQIQVIAANTALSCKQQGIECVYLTGSQYEKADKLVLEQLKAELSRQGIKVKEGGNICFDAASLQKAIEIGHILFVEQKGTSVYDEIYHELNLAKEQHSVILGAVVLV